MAYVTIPKDLSNVKTKVFLNLTKRQICCFAPAVLIGVPLFFLLKDYNTSMAALCMILVMLPFFLLAMYERNGQPLEVIAKQMIESKFLRPRERPYQTNNFYSALENQSKLEKEVRQIVKYGAKTKTNRKR